MIALKKKYNYVFDNRNDGGAGSNFFYFCFGAFEIHASSVCSVTQFFFVWQRKGKRGENMDCNNKVKRDLFTKSNYDH